MTATPSRPTATLLDESRGYTLLLVGWLVNTETLLAVLDPDDGGNGRFSEESELYMGLCDPRNPEFPVDLSRVPTDFTKKETPNRSSRRLAPKLTEHIPDSWLPESLQTQCDFLVDLSRELGDHYDLSITRPLLEQIQFNGSYLATWRRGPNLRASRHPDLSCLRRMDIILRTNDNRSVLTVSAS